jgi:hypothetical protein
MEKIQILFPEPQLNRLRQMAKEEDRPVSDLVRSAVEFWLARYGSPFAGEIRETPPVYDCGRIFVPSRDLRDLAQREPSS